MSDNKRPPLPSSTLPPAAAPFPGSRTPGWNDPPTLQFNPNTAGGNAPVVGRTPRLLNKRVAFPLQNTDTNMNAAAKPTAIVPPNQASLGSGGLPPPMSLPPAVAPAVGAVQPIAVVHPMRNMNAPPLASAIATPFYVPTPGVETGAAGAATHTTIPTTATLTATAIAERSNNAAPRIFVPPHQEESSSRPAAAVQHI